MRKNAFELSLCSLVVAVFGFFLRWLQQSNAFEEATGLAIPGAGTSMIFLGFSIVGVIFLLLVDRLYLPRHVELLPGVETMSCPTAFHRVVLWVPAVLTVVSGLILMFSADSAPFPIMQRITAALAVLAGACLPFTFWGPKAPAPEGGDKEDPHAIASTAAIMPILFGCVWLLTSYRTHAENPVLWGYVVEVLAVASLTVSFYYLAAFYYKRAKPARALLSCRISSYLCMCTLADGHGGAVTVLFAAMLIYMLAAQFIIVENGKAK